MLSSKASALIDKAVDCLMSEGWTQGRFLARKPEGGYSYCAAGALLKAAGGDIVDKGGEMYTILIAEEGFELPAYREVHDAYCKTFGVHLFRGNDLAEDRDDIVTQLMWLQLGGLDATQEEGPAGP